MVVTYGGMTVGQLLLNAGDPGGFSLFVLISVLVSLALVPISLTAVAAPSFDTPASVSLRQLYRISPLGVVGGLGAGAVYGIIFGMGAVYARGVGMSVAQVSLFMGLILFAGMLFQWPVGKLSDIFDRRKIILGASGLSAVLCLLAGLTPGISIPALVGVAFGLGSLALPMYSLCGAHLNDHLQPNQMVAASGGFVLISGLGASFGPLTASAAMSAVGPAGFFLAIALLFGGIMLFAVWRMTRRAPVPQEEQGSFVVMPPRASPIAAALNPEAPEDSADWEEISDYAEDSGDSES
jgi:MFS family permease